MLSNLSLTRPNDFIDDELSFTKRLFEDFGDFFQDTFDLGRRSDNMSYRVTLPVDVSEEGNNVIVTVDVPGFDPNSLEVKVTDGNVLTIKSERKGSTKNKYRHERAYGILQRAVKLPSMVDSDKTVAEYNNGVLTITLPKTSPTNSKTVPVKVIG